MRDPDEEIVLWPLPRPISLNLRLQSVGKGKVCLGLALARGKGGNRAVKRVRLLLRSLYPAARVDDLK